MIQRQLSFEEAITRALKEKYCCFSGRASRSEFWWFMLFGFICSAVCRFIIVYSPTFGIILNVAISLGLLLPQLGIIARRLHDINKSGWWLLMWFIPIVGWIILIVWWCKDSDPMPNQYGIVPNLVA